jgi:hypothetical protein
MSVEAIEVLDKCTTKRSKTTDEEYSVAFNFEFLESFNEHGR